MLSLDHAEDLQDAVEMHRDLVREIVVGNPDRAADLMRAHVEDFEQAMRKVLVTV
jgi:DNA-binding GntR family transcriptional regulator